mgnify:CR=1 FL=1
MYSRCSVSYANMGIYIDFSWSSSNRCRCCCDYYSGNKTQKTKYEFILNMYGRKAVIGIVK